MNKIVMTVLIGLLTLSGFVSSVNKTFKVSIEESKLTWTGTRVNYDHTGSVDLKSADLIWLSRAVSSDLSWLARLTLNAGT